MLAYLPIVTRIMVCVQAVAVAAGVGVRMTPTKISSEDDIKVHCAYIYVSYIISHVYSQCGYIYVRPTLSRYSWYMERQTCLLMW